MRDEGRHLELLATTVSSISAAVHVAKSSTTDGLPFAKLSRVQ